jgi:hypothetical protein
MRPFARAAGAALVLMGLVAAGSSAGCYVPHFLVWLFKPDKITKSVKEEYHLEADRLVIVPYVGTDILFTYPAAPIEVSGELVNAIARDLKGRVKTIIHPVEVVRWQESTLEWPTMSLERIAEEFQADTLLYVELGRYTMVEERSANLFRGRAKARIEVVKVGAEHNPVYDAVVEVIFPEDQPVGVLETSERVIRQGTNILLARDILRKFHDHKIEVRGGQP